MFTGLVLILSALTYAPESISVLALDVSGEVSDAPVAQETFSLAVQRASALPVSPGDSFGSLVLLLGCADKDDLCLEKIASSLNTRWLVFGALSSGTESLSLSVALFDANAGATVARIEGEVASPADREGFQKVITALFDVKEASTIRRGAEVVVKKSRAAPFLIAGGFLASAGAFGLGALLLKEGLVNNPNERAILTGLALGADLSIIAAGASLVIGIFKKKPVSEAVVQKTGRAVISVVP